MRYLAFLRRIKPELKPAHRCFSSLLDPEQEALRQNEIFQSELKRQLDKVGRIEKIEVTFNGVPEPCQLLLNKGISTPYNAAQHISEGIVEKAGLALVNNKEPWDMHRPLESDCEIDFLKFTDQNPFQINRAFWRTCSFLMGCVIKNAFKSQVDVLLHSFPSPNVTSGSFTYDAYLSESDWAPSKDELRSLSASMVKLASMELPIERLSVNVDIASEIFSENKFKLKQIPSIASQDPDGKIVLYRAGKHIDISKGPMVSNSSFLGRCSITAVHKIDVEGDSLYRFQGVALPKGVLLNHFAYGILEERSSRLNLSKKSSQPEEQQAAAN